MKSAAVERFLASMAIDAESWRDGIGYDLAAIDEATRAERLAMENALLQHGVSDWRDVQALARIATKRAQGAILAAAKRDGPRLCAALLSHAAELFKPEERTALLVAALNEAEPFDGLGEAIDLVPEHRAPEVIAALFEGCLRREGEIAVTYAGMLLHLHGLAEEPFDDSQRPFLLRFATDDLDERHRALRDLRDRIATRPA